MNYPIRVVHFYPVWLSQTATWLYYQILYLPDWIEPHVVCETTANLEQFPVSSLYSLSREPNWRSLIDRGLRRAGLRTHLGLLRRVVRQTHADLVHFHFGPMASANLPAIMGTGVRSCVTFYGLDVKQLPQNDPQLRKRYQWMFQHIDAVLCEGPFMASEIPPLGCPAEKVHVHHLGVPLKDLPYRPRSWRPGQPLKLLIASSWIPKKGIPWALQAIARLAAEIPLELTIVGDAPVGSNRGTLEKNHILELLATPPLRDITRQAGYVSHQEMIRMAYEHHIFVSTSITADNGDTEGGAPVAITEMAASGMPIVASRHCDIPNVVVDRKTGMLSDEKDVEGILESLRWFTANPAKWEPMLRAGRERIESLFDCSVQGKRLAELYAQVVSTHQRTHRHAIFGRR